MSAVIELPRLPSRLHAFLIAMGLVIATSAAGGWWAYASRIENRLEALARHDVDYWHQWNAFEDARDARSWDGLEVRRWEQAQLREFQYRAEMSQLESQWLVRDAQSLWRFAGPMIAAVFLGLMLMLVGRDVWAVRDKLEKDVMRAKAAGGTS